MKVSLRLFVAVVVVAVGSALYNADAVAFVAAAAAAAVVVVVVAAVDADVLPLLL